MRSRIGGQRVRRRPHLRLVAVLAVASTALASSSAEAEWVFCQQLGAHPLHVESRQQSITTVLVAPLELELAAAAPRIRIPRIVDQGWRRVRVANACLQSTPPPLPTDAPGLELVGAPVLVFGCANDSVGATFSTLAGAALRPPADRAMCATELDTRAACLQLSDGNAASTKRQRDEESQHRKRLAPVTARFALDGPAIAVRARPRATATPLLLIEHLLESESCGCGEDSARVVSSRVVPLRIPRLPPTAIGDGRGELMVWIAVPRYTGALYELKPADADADADADAATLGSVRYTDTFVADPPDDDLTLRAFSAPVACPCDCALDGDQAEAEPDTAEADAEASSAQKSRPAQNIGKVGTW
jgi:hypothetical protein